MNFIETSKALDEADIFNVEKVLGFELPSEFKEHYLEYNGGYPESDRSNWKDGSTTTINTFASIKYDGFSHLEKVYKNLAIEELYLPEKILPFATDDGGNLFCISAREKDYGCIYYCNNDHYNVNHKEECLTLVDKSFKGFIANLV